MPAPSQTGICNGTLVLLGTSKRIGAINEGTPLARQFEAVWDATRDELLAAHPWNFAIRRAALAASADVDPTAEGTQYAYAYELPAACLRWLPWSESHDDWFEGEQEALTIGSGSSASTKRFILSSNAAPIYIRYIARIEDLAQWSPAFISAMEGALAEKTAFGVTGSTRVADRMEAKAADRLSRAKRQDGLATGDRRRRAEYRSDWLSAREQSSGWGR